MYLSKYTTGAAAHSAAKCGDRKACDAWRMLSDAGRLARNDHMLIHFVKAMHPKMERPDNELENYLLRVRA